MTEAINMLRFSPKSIWSSTKIFKPLDAIVPKSKKEIPPITGIGIDSINAASLPTKLKIIAETAAPANTQTE